jgi:hypothetical protein
MIDRNLLATMAAMSLVACGSSSTTPSNGPGGSGVTDNPIVTPSGSGSGSDLDGLDLRLSNGKAGKPAYDHAQLPPAKKLSDADAAALLTRAQPLPVPAGDKKDFALRPSSQPVPRTATQQTSSFPPDPSTTHGPPPTATAAGQPLTVARYMPEGKVPLAPELNVTFSQPMIAVTSQEDAAAVQPVHLTPQPAGKWRWIGTRTILFSPDVRFPQATTYSVEVPAGTKAAGGSALAAATKFSFETPAPTIVQSWPGSSPSQRTDVPMFVLFDQKVDPQAMLPSIHVTAGGSQQRIRLMDAAEIEKDKTTRDFAAAAHAGEQDGRWVAFRTTAPLPSDAQVTVEIAAGAPSAEGPNKTPAAQSFAFHTYPPLTIVGHTCGWQDHCPPGTPFVIELSNPLDASKLKDGLVITAPDLDGVQTIVQGQNLVVQGQTIARTKYTVRVPAGLTDIFGQTLAKGDALDFNVTDAEPTFFGPSGVVVLDPAAAKPTLDVFSTNYPELHVKLFRETPAGYPQFKTYLANQWNHDHLPAMPGDKVFDGMVKTTAGDNKLVESHVDLSAALDKAGLGHAVAIVEPSPWKETYPPPRLIVWAQATKIAVDAHVDNDALVAMTTDLATGKALAGVELELSTVGTKGTSDAQGLATLKLPESSDAQVLVARHGDDVAFLPSDGGNNYYYGTNGWMHVARPMQLAWYVVDDRHLYKPGETVSLKGWLRVLDPGKGGDIGGFAGSVSSLSYKVMDSRNNQIGAGTMPVDPIGGFATTFVLPGTPNLGYARVDLVATGKLSGGYSHSFQIEEFRRPEFEVSAHASQGPFLVGSDGDVTVDAKYFSGGPLANAPVQWTVQASATSYQPPNHDDYTFGAWTPWWGGGGDVMMEEGEMTPYNGYHPPPVWQLAGKTDAAGSHVLHLDFLSVHPARPMSVVANAVVTDVNRQAHGTSAAIIVHPSSAYVGLHAQRAFVQQGTPYPLDVIGVDLDGKPLEGAKIELSAVRVDYTYKQNRYVREEHDPQHCSVVAAAAPGHCELATPKGGEYAITATIHDDKGRENTTSLDFWVAGGDVPAARDVAQERVQLIPNAKTYAAGDTADILVIAPFPDAEALVTWQRSGIVKTERLTLTGSSTTIHVPLTDAMVPGLRVQVDLVGAAVRTNDAGVPDATLPKRPAYAVGTIELTVPPRQRTLAVTATPSAAKLGPAEQEAVALEVKDADGKPVAGAEVAVIVVDEAVLSLTGYQFANPLDVFYTGRDNGVRDFYQRAYVKLAKPDARALAKQRAVRATGGAANGAAMMLDEAPSTTAAPGGAPPPPPPAPMAEPTDKSIAGKDDERKEAESGEREHEPAKPQQQQTIAVRSNFNPLAAFAPAVTTDAAGKASVSFKMPDNLTRYRVVAIAVAGEHQFGKGESAVTARLPLMVRPSPPRFLNFGDKFQLPVVVQNQTDAAMTVRVAVRASNAVLYDGAGREVTVPPNDRVEVQFPAGAELAGTARFQIVGVAGNASDAANISLPVWTPATTEAFATYGTIDDGTIKQPIALPGKVVTEFGGLEVSTTSTNLASLTDALLYLVHYPFECAEQRSSRINAIAALRDVLTAFHTADMPSQAEMEASVAADVEHLSQMQNSDGGFAYWDRGYPSEPYLSVYVTEALARAKLKGFTVPPQMLANAQGFLKTIDSHIPAFYGEEERLAIDAYALVARKHLGDLDIATGKAILKRAGGVDKVSMETDGWLLSVFAGSPLVADERAAIIKYATNHVSETAGAANFTTGYGDGKYLLLASDRRVDGVMLDALIEEQPANDLIPKIVTGLLAHRTAGRWMDTQENAFVLIALDRYFNTYEKVTPNFTARVWLGDDYAGDHAFHGHTTEISTIDVPMAAVASHDHKDLTIQKDGVGRLYYRIGMTYAPADLKLAAADYGFVVERKYEGVDDPADVTRTPDGTWHFKAGARVRVRITMVNDNRRYQVALVDPMPAGFEATNPALATTGPIPQDPKEQASRGDYWWWYGPWYDHQNMRDERVEAFSQQLWEGVHEYVYVARATTPGNFVVPPPKAEEMYMPETFGRGGSDRVVIE